MRAPSSVSFRLGALKQALGEARRHAHIGREAWRGRQSRRDRSATNRRCAHLAKPEANRVHICVLLHPPILLLLFLLLRFLLLRRALLLRWQVRIKRTVVWTPCRAGYAMPLAYSASGAGGPAPAPSCSTGTAPRSVLAGQSTSALAGPSGTSAQAAAALGAAPPVHQQHHHSATPLSDALLLALRQRPSTRLFRALFQYIPIRDSPNENPQLELPLQAGDYVLVHGEMDEDQFYQGETLDGQTGLVPSNYVERVNEQQLLLNCSRAPSPSFPLSVPAHLTQIQHDFSTTDSNVPLPDSVCPYPPVDVAKVTVQEIKQTDTPRGLFFFITSRFFLLFVFVCNVLRWILMHFLKTLSL